jgi:hypothetical protein
MARTRRPIDQDATSDNASPRMTIVGGRPPEARASKRPVPTGIEHVLRLASVDDAFRAQLVERRAAAAAAAGVELTPSERAILESVPKDQLLAMAASVPPPDPWRRDFLRQAAASAVVLLGGAALADCGTPACTPTRGISPDVPPPRPAEPYPPPQGIAPDVPPPRPEGESPPPMGMAPDLPPNPPNPPGPPGPLRPGEPMPPPAGAMPDVPPPKPPPRPVSAPPGGQPGEEAPARPDVPMVTRGIRPG